MNRQATPTPTDSLWPYRIRGALLLSAYADALARPFSGKPLPEPALVDAALQNPDPRVHQPGCGSTQTRVVAEHLAEYHGNLEENALAIALARRCGSHHAASDSPGTHKVLAEVATGTPWRESAMALHNQQGSYGNDAAVRATPIGLLSHTGVAGIAWLGRRSATVTHTHPLARDGAAVHAVAVALAAREQPHPAPSSETSHFLTTLAAQARTPEFRAALGIVRTLVRHRAGPAETAATVGHDTTALRSVPAALAAYLRHPEDPASAVRFAIMIGGDTSAIAAMTGAMVGARNPTYSLPAWDSLADTVGISSAANALARIPRP